MTTPHLASSRTVSSHLASLHAASSHATMRAPAEDAGFTRTSYDPAKAGENGRPSLPAKHLSRGQAGRGRVVDDETGPWRTAKSYKQDTKNPGGDSRLCISLRLWYQNQSPRTFFFLYRQGRLPTSHMWYCLLRVTVVQFHYTCNFYGSHIKPLRSQPTPPHNISR
ncbi:hypothetical protein B0H12DRAFT_287845 [Mycena haematopus]|nr:hypothetical protein B0H12DRAFT_287845 [Mycena haematopus]